MVTDKQCNYKTKFSETFLATFATELKGLGKDGGTWLVEMITLPRPTKPHYTHYTLLNPTILLFILP